MKERAALESEIPHCFATQEERIKESLTRARRTKLSTTFSPCSPFSPDPSYPSSTPPSYPGLSPSPLPPLWFPTPHAPLRERLKAAMIFFSKRGSCFGCTALSKGKVPTLRAPGRFGVCGGSPGMHRSASQPSSQPHHRVLGITSVWRGKCKTWTQTWRASELSRHSSPDSQMPGESHYTRNGRTGYWWANSTVAYKRDKAGYKSAYESLLEDCSRLGASTNNWILGRLG